MPIRDNALPALALPFKGKAKGDGALRGDDHVRL
jgi:hypothetical protein